MMPDWLSIGGGHCGQEVEGYFSFFTSDWVIIPAGRLLQIEADAKLRGDIFRVTLNAISIQTNCTHLYED